MKNLTIILFISLLSNFIFSQSAQLVEKQAGICFRIDDNQPANKYIEYAEIFDKNNANFTFALNLAMDGITPDYIEMVKDLQASGHEMMAHTPWHRTNYFYTNLGTNYYNEHPGVQRVNGSKVELKHRSVNTSDAKRSGNLSINGNEVYSSSGIFSSFSKLDCYLYFPSLNKLVFIEDWVDDKTVIIRDIWRNSINLGSHSNIQFYNFDNKNVHLTIDAVKALMEETLRLAEHYSLEKPTSWIQPGGSFPRLYSYELNEALSELGFNAGGVFADPALKVFNEYDPSDSKQFGMNWGDFYEDTKPLEELKEFIADRVAKHQVLVGHSHFSGLLDNWDGYLQRTDELIKWCLNNNIPIRTYNEWANILYFATPNPNQNVFPALNSDKDNNNYPDGYSNLIKTKEQYVNFEGIWDKNDGVGESLNHSFSINKAGNICYVGKKNWWEIDGLAGLEKGENDFEIWTKGEEGNFIEVDFKIGNNNMVFKFPAENSEWTKYNLSNSINGNNTLIIPENISLIDISIRCSDFSSGTVKVSGMKLHKKIELHEFSLDLSVLLEGAYSGANQMKTLTAEELPLVNPFNTEPWNYEGTESISEVPNENVVDWVLVSLYTESTDTEPAAMQACFLLNDGNIVDLDGSSALRFTLPGTEYYIKVEHRNHLAVMSAEPVSIINTQ